MKSSSLPALFLAASLSGGPGPYPPNFFALALRRHRSTLSWWGGSKPRRRRTLLERVTERRTRRRTADAYPDPVSADDHLVTDLPGLAAAVREGRTGGVPVPTLHAGHVRTGPAGGKDVRKLFYWLVAPEPGAHASVGQTPPLLIWLNGGPGCSSNDGFFLENGPFRLSADPPGDPAVDGGYVDMKSGQKVQLSLNPHSWHRSPAYVLYIDQPVGTGLSFTSGKRYCKNDEEVDADFYGFLINFLTLHADKFLLSDAHGGRRLNRPLYFSGESHAGHYIPSMIDYIRKKNKERPDVVVPVAGAAIGNGWFDPYHQYAATEAGYGHGFIDMAQARSLDLMERTCRASLEKGNFHSSTCFKVSDVVLDESAGHNAVRRASMYDTRLFIKHGTFPAGKRVVESYLGGAEALRAAHATQAGTAGLKYMECTDPPYYALSHQDGLGVVDEIVGALKGGVRMLFFNGMNDMVCNHVRNEMAIENFPWKKIDQWQQAERYVWNGDGRTDGAPAGYMKEFENLMYLKVKEAGHMVPMDQPERALDMIRTFIYELSFKEGLKQNIKPKVFNGKECPSCPSCENELATFGEKFFAGEVSGTPASSAATTSRTMNFAVFLFVIGLGSMIYAAVLIRSLRNKERRNKYTVASIVEGDDEGGLDMWDDSLESDHGAGGTYKRGANQIQLTPIS